MADPAKPRDIECPTCGAGAGRYCNRQDGTLCWSRVEAWGEVVKAETVEAVKAWLRARADGCVGAGDCLTLSRAADELSLEVLK